MRKLFIIVALVLFGALSINTFAQEKETMVIIHTDMGDIKVKLYNETPKHRDNFIKLVKEGWYDESVFHRVINQFMIQGGHNKAGVVDPGYKVDAEFDPGLYHKRGALAAARQGDQVNPQRKSSGCQFYIVQSTRTFTDSQLQSNAKRNNIFYTAEQIKTYKEVGGTPFLDGAYTVFGEVVEGMDVVDKIAVVQTSKDPRTKDRPIEDIKMTMEIVD